MPPHRREGRSGLRGQGPHLAGDARGEPVGLGLAQLVGFLEIQPELGRDAEIGGETQGGVRGDGAPAVHDVADALGRRAQFACRHGMSSPRQECLLVVIWFDKNIVVRG